ncbi:TPA: hypothetical protein UM348_001015 [Stenotrophomonas maltophilia]|nr:hypothetical protein [Stenotrophomonas sp.]HEL4148315.1 hypothetical protein [Stenotrophomonas maltophilia]
MTRKSEAKQSTSAETESAGVTEVEGKGKCGIIRPIAPTEGYPGNHWSEVGEILSEAIISAGFEPRIVSEADSVAVIHGTIVQNIYEDPIIVCDVSSRNPNVMFELGMRLAFDKPVVIVKDDITNYAFDTGVIEHLPYPKSLHYHEIGIFKKKLRDKILHTIERSKEADFSPFLKHFRHLSISPQKLENENVPLVDYIAEKLDQLESKINRIYNKTSSSYSSPRSFRTLQIPAPAAPLTQAAIIASLFDSGAKLSRQNGVIQVNANVTHEQARKIMSAIRSLDRGIPLDSIIPSMESGSITDSVAQSDENSASGATEIHPIPE